MGSSSTWVYAANFTLRNLKGLWPIRKSDRLRVGDNAWVSPGNARSIAER